MSGPEPVGSPRRLGNFDLLRLIAASCVIFSHSFAIVNGSEDAEPLVMLLGRGNILGLYGVYTFFIISGFLITASFEQSSMPDYVVKRCLRIFPGLLACAVVTTAVAMLVSGGALHWPALAESIRYVVRTVLLIDTTNAALPGVVFSDNDFGRIFNGSLWSLGPEFLCYVVVAVLGLAAMLHLRAALLMLALGLYTHTAGLLGQIGYVLPFFAAGAVLHFWTVRPALTWTTFGIALTGLLLGAIAGHPSLAFALFGGWLIVAFATGPRQIGGATRFGDLSYGLYLYGWPIEQTVTSVLGSDATWWLVFAIALPLAALAALISWHLVERPAIRFGRSAALDPVRTALGG